MAQRLMNRSSESLYRILIAARFRLPHYQHCANERRHRMMQLCATILVESHMNWLERLALAQWSGSTSQEREDAIRSALEQLLWSRVVDQVTSFEGLLSYRLSRTIEKMAGVKRRRREVTSLQEDNVVAEQGWGDDEGLEMRDWLEVVVARLRARNQQGAIALLDSYRAGSCSKKELMEELVLSRRLLESDREVLRKTVEDVLARSSA